MNRILPCAALLALLALSGCAGMSKNQCLANDWETVGYRDGLAGTQSSALLNYHDACVDHGVVPDRNAYLVGWNDGVEQYCQPTNGFMTGQRGVAYGNVCPTHLQDAFYAAYQDGQRIYGARTEVANVQHAISQRQQRLQDVKAELAAIAAGMLEPESTTADRAEMLLTANNLNDERSRLNREIDDLEDELVVRNEHLADLRQTVAYAN